MFIKTRCNTIKILVWGIPKKEATRFSVAQPAFSKTYMAKQRYSERMLGRKTNKHTLRRIPYMILSLIMNLVRQTNVSGAKIKK